ncbi:MAG TPA: MlaD family protein [Gemmatimonadaceae bacterium]|nr:MlaD family protein [Gemmatimonadaceae bacterium]
MRRRDEVLVGIFTLVAVIVLIAGVLWLARGGLSRGYPLYARFAWGAGLKQSQPVLFSGVNVGYVDNVDLLEDGGLVVTLRIYKNQRVPEGTIASIMPNGIFGDMLIALRPTKGATGVMLAAGDTIPSGPGTTGLGDVVARVDTIAVNLNKLITALHGEVVDKRGIADARKAVQSADSMFRTITALAKEQSRQLTTTQESLRRVGTKLDSLPLDSVVRDLREASRHVVQLTDDFKETSSRLRSVLAKADTGKGTIAQLLNDPKALMEFRGLMVRMDSLLTDFQRNPRKYIRVSIF